MSLSFHLNFIIKSEVRFHCLIPHSELRQLPGRACGGTVLESAGDRVGTELQAWTSLDHRQQSGIAAAAGTAEV